MVNSSSEHQFTPGQLVIWKTWGYGYVRRGGIPAKVVCNSTSGKRVCIEYQPVGWQTQKPLCPLQLSWFSPGKLEMRNE